MDFHSQFEKGLAGTTPTEGKGKPLLHWCLLLLLAHSKIVAFVSTIFFKEKKKVKMSQFYSYFYNSYSKITTTS